MRRTAILGGLLGAGLLAAWRLKLDPGELVPAGEGWNLVGRFFRAAFSPTLTSESDLAGDLLPRILEGTRNTIAFAAAAMSLSLVMGSVLGVLASERWWQLFALPRGLRPVLYGGFRTLIAFLRSVHEILWAILLLAAFGLSTAAAVVAISIPYGGTLAKVFSEMLDEAEDSAADAMRWGGATSSQSFAFGLIPRALPDMGAYAFYRFECALRSAAILGFFGFPTLGKFLYESFGELYFREAWTYLYVLFGLILVVEWWSGALRQRLTVA